jgi:rhodanese-related sulfurtransferase
MRVEKVAGTRVSYLDPLQLAEWIFDKQDDFLLVDLRTRSKFAQYHLPYAKHLGSLGMDASALHGKPMIVAYLGDASVPPDVLAVLSGSSSPEVYLLWGGVDGWAKRVLFPDLTHTRSLKAEEIERIAKLSRYFGGTPRLLEEQTGRTPAGYLREGC